MFFHWGEESGDTGGSEHTISHQSFPIEIQLYGFNSQIYSNLTEARTYPGGVVAVAIMVTKLYFFVALNLCLKVQLRSAGHKPNQIERQEHKQSGLGMIATKLGQVCTLKNNLYSN